MVPGRTVDFITIKTFSFFVTSLIYLIIGSIYLKSYSHFFDGVPTQIKIILTLFFFNNIFLKDYFTFINIFF